MVCTSSASDGHRTEGHAPRRLNARRDCCALAAARRVRTWWWTGLGRLRGPIRNAGAVLGGAEGAANAAVSGKTAPCRKKNVETRVCAGFRAGGTRLREHRLTRDNCCYRESIGQFRCFRRSAGKARPVAGGQCRSCRNAIQPVDFTAVSSSREVRSAPSAPPAPEDRACAGRRN